MKASIAAIVCGYAAGINLRQLHSEEVSFNVSFDHVTSDSLAVNADLSGPTWMLRSTNCGAATDLCGATVSEAELEECTEEDLKKYASISQVIRTNPGGITGLVARSVLLGSGGPRGLLRCVSGKPHPRDDSHPLRLILDAQYENFPRCCPLEVIDGMMVNQGVFTSWAKDAAQKLSQRTFREMHYVQVSPSQAACNNASKCPMVVQIAGGGDLVETIGDPWLLMQSACPACHESLRATLIAPEMPQDIVGEDNVTMGTRSETIRHTLLPLVEDIIHTNPQVDAEKVYILAQSRGVDTALRAALQHPHVFSLAVLSGMFLVTPETLHLIQSNFLSTPGSQDTPRRLANIQFHLGDVDHCFPVKDFYEQFTSTLSALSKHSNVPKIDLRVYPDSAHSVWYAAWNSLHEVIWTNTRGVPRDSSTVPLSCVGGK